MGLTSRAASALIAAVAAAACASSSSSARVAADVRTDGPDAIAACSHSGYMKDGAVLRAAYASSGAVVAAWQFDRLGPSGPHAINTFVKQHQGDERLYVCYIDSNRLAPPGGSSTSGTVVTEVAVDGSETTDHLGGRLEDSALERPHLWK